MGQVMEIPGTPSCKSPAEIFLARGGSGGGGGVPGECLISCQVAADALRPSYMVTLETALRGLGAPKAGLR